MRSVPSTEEFPVRLARLRAKRGLTLERLAFATQTVDQKGLTTSAVSQLERGLIRPKTETIRVLAAALGVDPNEFPEYRLACMRELFDERLQGIDTAWHNYREFSRALMLLATQPATELEHTGSSDAQPVATDAEVRNLLEARRRSSG